jgi:two-component system nitrate/nitrite response regulator NarL
MDELIRIVIADDHPMFREGVVKTLSDFANCEVVAECGSADEAFEAVCEHLPDIALLDVSMPGGGIEAARRIAVTCPVVRILMLTASESGSVVMEALEVGASGYVLKGVGGEELSTIIKAVHEGGVYVSPSLAARMLVDVKDHKKAPGADLFSDLTAREEEILKYVSQGLSNKEVADALNRSEKTVKHYMTVTTQPGQIKHSPAMAD